MQPGDRIGKYTLLDRLGQGGEGTVFLAVHRQTQQLWTIKLTKAQDNDALLREARMLQRLRHPGLPVLVDVLDTPEGICLVTDYVRGRNLQQLLAQRGSLPADQVIRIGQALCDALSYLHTRHTKILHLDLKPSNIMLTDRGAVKLLDFGAAEKAGSDTRIHYGTDGFAAPEQYQGDRGLDERADLYGVGAVLYYALTGHKAEPGTTGILHSGIRKAALTGTGTSRLKRKGAAKGHSQYPAALLKVLNRCLLSEPDQRYCSCSELRDALLEAGNKMHRARVRLRSEAAILLGLLALLTIRPGMQLDLRSGAEQVLDYDRCLELAERAPADERWDLYRKALFLQPANPAAYEQLLDEIAADTLFDEEEEKQVRQLLGTIHAGSGRTCEEWLESVPESGGLIAWKLGLLYRFSYAGDGAVRIAHAWLSRAAALAQTCSQPPDWAQSAVLIDRLSGYSGSVTVPAAITSAQEAGLWWKDLMALSDLSPAQQLPSPLNLKLSLECMNRLLTRIGYIHQAGIGADGLGEGLDMLVQIAGMTGQAQADTPARRSDQGQKEDSKRSSAEDPELKKLQEDLIEREKQIRIQIGQIRRGKGVWAD